ncbi:hypothetical protein AVDCRST_MAG92-4913 [uncultured Coleofasciculus sp.]|uniref:Uncharacterized protein n=1 Tax=uncultured Coleofasciculus sp. TaxID=1267456 RepID=A0A6J4K8F1_9CYAN|nr:hypothetical protein AVDCRST_MAG92-4913 [uncultured Coleofasciculus sp.]
MLSGLLVPFIGTPDLSCLFQDGRSDRPLVAVGSSASCAIQNLNIFILYFPSFLKRIKVLCKN